MTAAGIGARVFCKDLQWRELWDFGSSGELVRQISKHEPSECSCPACVKMCRTVPCLGTPEEIERIMAAGHGAELRRTTWLAGVMYGVPAINMIQFRNTRAGCPMLRDDRCTLHAAGLKPTEGARSSCSERVFIHESATFAAALSWLLPCNAQRVAALFERLTELERRAAV